MDTGRLGGNTALQVKEGFLQLSTAWSFLQEWPLQSNSCKYVQHIHDSVKTPETLHTPAQDKTCKEVCGPCVCIFKVCAFFHVGLFWMPSLAAHSFFLGSVMCWFLYHQSFTCILFWLDKPSNFMVSVLISPLVLHQVYPLAIKVRIRINIANSLILHKNSHMAVCLWIQHLW